MTTLTVIMKVTNRCNYKCVYCYIDERAPREALTIETAELALQKCFYSKHDALTFVWHGGEPLLRGLDFYSKLLAIEERLKLETGKPFRNAIQTNAGLLTPEAVSFFKQNSFHLGTSLDGPEELTNATRPQGTRGSYESTMRGISRMQSGGMRTGAIATITRKNVRYPTAIYEHFKKNNIDLKVGNLVDAGEAKNHDDLGLTPEEYGIFLQELLDVYFNDQNPTIGIRPFDNMIRNVAKSPERVSSECIHAGSCHEKFISIAPNGDIYPCGYFQGIEQFRYGNISMMGIDEIERTAVWQLLEQRTRLIADMCGSCDFYSMCHGGCPFSAFANRGDILQKDYYCEAFKMIFARIIEKVKTKEDGTEKATLSRILSVETNERSAATSTSTNHSQTPVKSAEQNTLYTDVVPYADYTAYADYSVYVVLA